MAISSSSFSADPDDEDPAASSIVVDINVTPLVDIMLVLLIIFMVSATVMSESGPTASGIHVDLPKAKARGEAKEQADLVIALTTDGQIISQGESHSIEQIRAILERAHQENPKTVLIIQADKEVKHGRVAEILDLARSIGLEKLSIATEESSN